MNSDHILIEQFLRNHPDIFIQIIEDWDYEDIGKLLEDLAPDQAGFILSRLSHYKSGKVIENLPQPLTSSLLNSISLADSEAILRVTVESVREAILNSMDDDKSSFIRKSLSFSKEEVGSYLDPYVLYLNGKDTVESTLNKVKNSGGRVRSHLYAVDDHKKLIGYVQLNDLIIEKPEKTISSLLNKVPVTVHEEMQITDLLEAWNDAFIDLPVTKINGEFLGTVSREAVRKNTNLSAEPRNPAIKAGNALGDLYLIGLSSLIGNTEPK